MCKSGLERSEMKSSQLMGHTEAASPLSYSKEIIELDEHNLSNASEKPQNKEMSPIFQRIVSAVDLLHQR